MSAHNKCPTLFSQNETGYSNNYETLLSMIYFSMSTINRKALGIKCNRYNDQISGLQMILHGEVFILVHLFKIGNMIIVISREAWGAYEVNNEILYWSRDYTESKIFWYEVWIKRRNIINEIISENITEESSSYAFCSCLAEYLKYVVSTIAQQLPMPGLYHQPNIPGMRDLEEQD